MELPDTYIFQDMQVPAHVMPGLHRYINHHTPVGHFLTAVLSNDLKKAVGRADDENIHNLPAIVAFLYNEAPGSCWGSPEKVKEWLSKPGEEVSNERN